MSVSKGWADQTNAGGVAAVGESGGPSHPCPTADEFISKLYKLVDDPSVDDLISWNKDGSSFIISKPHEFAHKLLPKYFNCNDFPSFVSKLTTAYGFRKADSGRWELSNDFFKQGEILLLQLIQRRPFVKKVKDRGSSLPDHIDTAHKECDKERTRLTKKKPQEASVSTTATDNVGLSCILALEIYGLSYCALFPCDYDYQEETLIQLWLADGLIVQEPMELIASKYFKRINHYFIPKSTNFVTGKTLYKADRLKIGSRERHMATIDSKSNLTDLSENVSHISVLCDDFKDSITVYNGIKRFGKLRMLIFLQGSKSSFSKVPRDFFLSLKLLRILDMSQTQLMDLPSSIGSMKCLRYLDLSLTPLKYLPEAIGNLENLQTLKLRGCSNMSTLPKGTKKLLNLRHLDMDVLGQLSTMPQGIGALTNLQSLSAFIVGKEEGCNIRQLMNMNNLSGSFCLSRLENVLTDEEAKDACLCYKSQLKKLEYRWGKLQGDNESHTKILSSLRPNEGLVELCISGYGGSELPSWMCPTFSMLMCITIFECENCIALPSSLRKLPSLRYLNLFNFPKLKSIDHRFFGIEKDCIPFPKLEKFTIGDMNSLEEFTGSGGVDFGCLSTLMVKHCPKLHQISIFSSFLKHLEISQCARLKYWADGKLAGNLETIIIEDCPMISASLLNGVHYWDGIANLPNVWIDNQKLCFGER